MSAERPKQPAKPKKPAEIIVLIHGIRTQAEWQNMVAAELTTPTTEVWPLKYEFFDAFRFWLPFGSRRRPVGDMLRELRRIKSENPEAMLSVIAHSFGTYVIGRILRDETDIRLHRLVLCGSVLPRRFRWDIVGDRIATHVVNDCGTWDAWPVLAQSSSFGYGASGTFGFGRYRVRDRFHNFKHSGFFDEQFVRTFWKPLFTDNALAPGENPTVRRYVWSLLTVLQIKWLLAVLLLLVFWYLGVIPQFWGDNDTAPQPRQLMLTYDQFIAQVEAKLNSGDGGASVDSFVSGLKEAETTVVDWNAQIIGTRKPRDDRSSWHYLVGPLGELLPSDGIPLHKQAAVYLSRPEEMVTYEQGTPVRVNAQLDGAGRFGIDLIKGTVSPIRATE